MTETRKFLVDVLANVYRPVAKSRLEDWAEANIILRQKESIDFPGPYQKHRTIYAPRLLDAFVGDSSWRSLIVQKSSQSALTLHVLILCCRWIAEGMGNILYVIDSASKAKQLSRIRFRPMLEDCRATKFAIGECEDEMTNLSYDLPTAAVWLVGAHSAGGFASNPASLVLGDELDKWPDLADESHGWELARQRIKKAESGRAIGFSTPTTEDGTTHRAFRTGSQHKYFVPCPECGTMQPLEFEGLRFSHCRDLIGDYDLARVLAETRYACEICGTEIEEIHKEDMLAGGEWRPTNFRDQITDGQTIRVPAWNPGEMSAQVNDLYSTHPSSTWGQIAVEFLLARGDSNKLQDWENGRMGRPIKKTVSNITVHHVTRLRGEYSRRKLPIVPCIATMAIDNQGDHQKWVKGAFEPDGTMWIVDWGKSLDLREADLLADAPIETPAKSITCQRVIVDEGGKGGTSYEVRAFCAARFPRFFPAKGRGGLQVRHTINWSPSRIDQGGLQQIDVCHFDDDAFKRALYLDRIKNYHPDRVMDYPLPRIWLPRDATEEFVNELCAEQLKKVTDANGVPGFQWVTQGKNDWGDCVKMLLVLWNIIGHHFSAVGSARPEV